MTIQPKPGLVCWAMMPVLGTSERKPRTVMVISSEKFSSRTGFVHLLPISTTPPAAADVLMPKMLPGAGKLDPKSRIVVDILITDDVKFLRDPIGEIDSQVVRAAVDRFKATLG